MTRNGNNALSRWLKSNVTVLAFGVSVGALVVSLGGLLVNYVSTFPSSNVSIAIHGANKNFLKQYIADEQGLIKILLNGEIRNTGAATRLINVKPSVKISVYRYEQDPSHTVLHQIADVGIQFVPTEQDFVVYLVDDTEEYIHSGSELRAGTGSTQAFVNTLLDEDACHECKRAEFPVAEGYSHIIVEIFDHHTLGFLENSRFHPWLQSKLKHGAEIRIENAIFLARIAPDDIDPLDFYGEAFLRFGNGESNVLERILVDCSIGLEIRTEDGQAVHAAERFFSVGYLVRPA